MDILPLTIAAAVGIIGLGSELISLFAGLSYLEGVKSLHILAVAIVFAVLNGINTTIILIPLREEKLVLKATICSAVLNLMPVSYTHLGFVAGLDGCLKCGADIIVNTDADNQYCGDDIAVLIQPILDGEADMVIGERPIDDTEHFSYVKKKLQHFGSWVVRKASNTDIPDAPSGFRAFSRDAAMRINVVNDYTYTLETIVQAGREKIAIASVPIRTNAELRPSRLFKSIWGYVKKSVLTILRAYMMYKPLMCFTLLSIPSIAIGLGIGIRFLYFMSKGSGSGHIQSLILACTLIIVGFLTFMIGLVADVIAANRKILQDVQYHIKRMEYEMPVFDNNEKDKKEGVSEIYYFNKEKDEKVFIQ